MYKLHRHKVNTLEMITATVIHGSGIIPTAFIVNAGELKSLNTANVICKFADDTYAIIGASAINARIRELDNIEALAQKNKLKPLSIGVLKAKTVQLVFGDIRRTDRFHRHYKLQE